MSDDQSHRHQERRFTWRGGLDVAATLLMMITAGVVIWHFVNTKSARVAARPTVPLPTAPLALDAAPTLGSPNASVAMLIFSDFECPFCARFAAETMPALKRQYVDSGKVRFAFRHFPLSMHTRALRAAESAECAERQGRFWDMHDALFRPPVRLAEPELESHAREVGLDLVAFRDCMAGAAAAHAEADSAMAKKLGLTATPSVIVGVATKDGTVRATEVIVGVQPLQDFVKALEQALAKVRGL